MVSVSENPNSGRSLRLPPHFREAKVLIEYVLSPSFIVRPEPRRNMYPFGHW